MGKSKMGQVLSVTDEFTIAPDEWPELRAPESFRMYLDNLRRLGVVTTASPTPPSVQQVGHTRQAGTEAIAVQLGNVGGVELTRFGMAFVQVAVEDAATSASGNS
jgi:hypothetical protein